MPHGPLSFVASWETCRGRSPGEAAAASVPGKVDVGTEAAEGRAFAYTAAAVVAMPGLPCGRIRMADFANGRQGGDRGRPFCLAARYDKVVLEAAGESAAGDVLECRPAV